METQNPTLQRQPSQLTSPRVHGDGLCSHLWLDDDGTPHVCHHVTDDGACGTDHACHCGATHTTEATA